MKRFISHGDSITEGSDLDKYYTWPTLLGNRLNIDVINSGIGGDSTAGLLSRFYPDVIQQHPDFVLILGGTNDVWWNLDVNTVQSNIFTMVYQAQYHNIAPIIGTPLPIVLERFRTTDWMEPVCGYERFTENVFQLATSLRNSANKNDIPIIDFYKLFLDEKGTIIGDYFMEDGIHANKKGHRMMAEKISELMVSVFYFS